MALEVKDLKKSFKKRTVVNSVSLNISKGEIVGLLAQMVQVKAHHFI